VVLQLDFPHYDDGCYEADGLAQLAGKRGRSRREERTRLRSQSDRMERKAS